MRKATATAARVVPWPKDGPVPPPGPNQPLGRGLSAVVDRITGDVEPLGGAALDPALEDPAVLLRGLGVLVRGRSRRTRAPAGRGARGGGQRPARRGSSSARSAGGGRGRRRRAGCGGAGGRRARPLGRGETAGGRVPAAFHPGARTMSETTHEERRQRLRSALAELSAAVNDIGPDLAGGDPPRSAAGRNRRVDRVRAGVPRVHGRDAGRRNDPGRPRTGAAVAHRRRQSAAR